MSKDVEVGPIYNQKQAEEKADKFEREHPEWTWTGHWKTIIQGKMSVINVRYLFAICGGGLGE